MKFGSVFSGVGGFDLGFSQAGLECAWMAETDANASKVLARHWPNVKNYGDVKNVKKSTAESVDVICGGFPCQDVSVAGKRAGLAGERSGLWFEFARIIDEFEPGVFVIENVPGLLSSDEGRDFATIIRWLVGRGYGVAWRVLDAQYFGVAQRRRRVFIVGNFGDGRAAEILFEREGLRGDTPPSRQAWERIASPVTASPPNRRNGGSNPTEGAFVTSEVARPLRSQAQIAHREDADTLIVEQNNVASTPDMISLRSNPAQPVIFDGRNMDMGDVSQTLQAKKNGYSLNFAPMVLAHGQANAEIVSDGEPSLTTNHEAPILAATSWTLRQGKEGGGKGYLGNEDQAMTLGGQTQFVGVRRLTPTECERLQGFPDGWTDQQADSTRYRQMGNAVAVPVAKWIGERILRAQTL